MFVDRFPFARPLRSLSTLLRIVFPVRRFAKDGVIFSMFLGILFVISCIVDSLNLFGTPGFLVGFMRKGGGAALQQQDIIRYEGTFGEGQGCAPTNGPHSASCEGTQWSGYWK